MRSYIGVLYELIAALMSLSPFAKQLGEYSKSNAFTSY